MPAAIERLPVDARGYPVPWFAAWLQDGRETPIGVGAPDFRVVGSGRLQLALEDSRCWVCGEPLTPLGYAFVIGPMCAINRTSAEPPSHITCADWSARACPFLTRPKAHRREANLPAERGSAGIMLERNPGVALVWITNDASAFRVPNGILLNVGSPRQVRWYAQGRPATREEVQESIDSGLPALRSLAEQDGPDAIADLERRVTIAAALLPDAAQHREPTP